MEKKCVGKKIMQDIQSYKSNTEACVNILQTVVDIWGASGATLCKRISSKFYTNQSNPHGIIHLVVADYPSNVLKTSEYKKQKVVHKIYEENMISIPLRFKKCIGRLVISYSDKKALMNAELEDDFAKQQKESIITVMQMALRIHILEEKCKQFKQGKKSNKVKNNFMANISHEIHKPLNAMIGGIECMRDQIGKSEMLDIMQKASYDLLYLVNDILDMSGLESGKIQLHYSSIALQELVDSCYAITKSGRRAGVDFSVSIDSDMPESVITDPQRTKQIVTNLLSNAFKFTHQGEVKVRISRATNADLKEMDLKNIDSVVLPVKGKMRSGTHSVFLGRKIYIKFSISDTGIGIKAQDRDKIFKSFSQIDNDSNKLYEGTGLGLAISTGFCDLMEGAIEFQSKDRIGSTFYFVIPVQEYKSSNSKLIDYGKLNGKLALIVDDKIENLMRISSILDKYGMNHYTCVNSDQAKFSYINNPKYKFDIGLLDVYTLEKDVNELAKYISQHQRNFPLIALNSAEDKIFDITGFFDITLDKPYEEKVLIHHIYNLICEESSEIKPTHSDIFRSAVNDNKKRRYSENMIKKKPVEISGKFASSNSLLVKKSCKFAQVSPLKIPESIIINTGIHIIIIDDSESNQVVLKQLLNKIGYYNTTCCANGEQAVELVKKNNGIKLPKTSGKITSYSDYDVVLMDMRMPVMDGVETAKKINKMFCERVFSPFIIGVFTTPESEYKSFLQTGILDDYLMKPINMEKILELLKSIRRPVKILI